MEVGGSRWRSVEVNESRGSRYGMSWKSMKADGSRWKSMEASGSRYGKT